MPAAPSAPLPCAAVCHDVPCHAQLAAPLQMCPCPPLLAAPILRAALPHEHISLPPWPPSGRGSHLCPQRLGTTGQRPKAGGSMAACAPRSGRAASGLAMPPGAPSPRTAPIPSREDKLHPITPLHNLEAVLHPGIPRIPTRSVLQDSPVLCRGSPHPCGGCFPPSAGRGKFCAMTPLEAGGAPAPGTGCRWH